MVISVFPHSADLKAPAEKAAVRSKELVSSAGVLYPDAAPRNSCFLSVAVLSLVVPEMWNVLLSATVVQRSQWCLSLKTSKAWITLFLLLFIFSVASEEQALATFQGIWNSGELSLIIMLMEYRAKQTWKLKHMEEGRVRWLFFPSSCKKKKKTSLLYSSFFPRLQQRNPYLKKTKTLYIMPLLKWWYKIDCSLK